MQDLESALLDARERTLALVADLTDEQLIGPRIATVNPLLWEIGHVAWFQEKWVLREGSGLPSILPGADALYDSAAVPHDGRWDLLLPSRQATLAYLRDVRDRAIDRLTGRCPSPAEAYFHHLSLFHEDMHGEAFLYTRQNLGYPPPPALSQELPQERGPAASAAVARGDASVPRVTMLLGATSDAPFVFDNEKWAHPVELAPFAIARDAVTQGEFADFVDDRGYDRREFWSDAGWSWRSAASADRPLHWRREGGAWMRRCFDTWVPLEPELAVIQVSWHEADAYCRWAWRRLPTEAEWEAAAALEPDAGGDPTPPGRRFPWGSQAPRSDQANLDARALGCVAAAALPAGDSAVGCRQMIGNVWEWTADDFLPYPGFVRDPYAEYSEPWFGTHKVLRGGCWATRARLLRNTWRNFYKPDRRDVFAGFRTCAL